MVSKMFDTLLQNLLSTLFIRVIYRKNRKSVAQNVFLPYYWITENTSKLTSIYEIFLVELEFQIDFAVGRKTKVKNNHRLVAPFMKYYECLHFDDYHQAVLYRGRILLATHPLYINLMDLLLGFKVIRPWLVHVLSYNPPCMA